GHPFAVRRRINSDAVTHFVADGVRKLLMLDYDLSRERTTIDPFKRRGGQWLRRSTRRGRQDESAGVEHRRIIVRSRLNVVPQQRVLLDHFPTLLLFRRDGLLAAIFGVRNQNSQ